MYNKNVIESNKRFKTLYDVKIKEYKEYVNKFVLRNYLILKNQNLLPMKKKKKWNQEHRGQWCIIYQHKTIYFYEIFLKFK